MSEICMSMKYTNNDKHLGNYASLWKECGNFLEPPHVLKDSNLNIT